MHWWLILVCLSLTAVAGVLALGWRDGWLGPWRPRRAAPQPGPEGGTRFVGIAEVVRFAAMRRRIGFAAAEQIMGTLARRLAEVGDLAVARVGRSELEFTGKAESMPVAESMLALLKERLEQPLEAGLVGFEPEIAIGASPVPPGRPEREYFDDAALALEQARGAGQLIHVLHGPARPERESSTTDLFVDLRRAIAGGGLDLHYMPKLRLRDERIIGVEALCRWPRSASGEVPASQFIRLAEDTGLIGDLTSWVLDRAIADQARLSRAEGIDLDVHINVSARLIGNPRFCDELLARIGTASGRIGIEITETAVIQDSASALASLERLRSAGVHVAIDDFGAGLASLAYLRNLPADELKIDQMFIRELTTSHRDPLLVRSAIDIAHALEMEVTAEGVEDEIALALLKVMRCDHVQGYHLSPPLPLPQLVRFLRARQQPLPGALTA